MDQSLLLSTSYLRFLMFKELKLKNILSEMKDEGIKLDFPHLYNVAMEYDGVYELCDLWSEWHHQGLHEDRDACIIDIKDLLNDIDRQ